MGEELIPLGIQDAARRPSQWPMYEGEALRMAFSKGEILRGEFYMGESRLNLFKEKDIQAPVRQVPMVEFTRGGFKNVYQSDKAYCLWILWRLMSMCLRRIGELGGAYYQFSQYLLIKGKSRR